MKTTAYPETNAEVIEKALYCLKHGETESVENWLGLLQERLAASHADALTDKVVDHCWKMYQQGQISADHTAKQVFAEVLQSFADWLIRPVEQHEAAPADDYEARRHVAEALGITWPGTRDGKRVGYAWSYLLGCIKDATQPEPPAPTSGE